MKLMKKDNQLQIIASIYGRLLDGETDGEIMDSMGLTVQEYHRFKETMYQLKSDELKQRPIEHVYVDYVVNQTENVQKLTQVVEAMLTSREYTNVLVGAIRAKSDIQDKILKHGQDFGIIKKQSDSGEIVAGLTVSELTNDDLKKAITGALKDLDRMTQKYGELDIKELKAQSEIYYGETLDEQKKKEKKKQKHFKVKPKKLNKGRSKKRTKSPLSDDDE